MKRLLFLGALSAMLALPVPGSAQRPEQGGVKVDSMSPLRKLIPADQIETMAAQEYTALTQGAKQQGVLAPDNDPQLQRLRRIANRLVPYAQLWNDRADQWNWEISLIQAPEVNAFVMPGGKIIFFTGLLAQLKLTEDEIAVVMGHEIAHALREHARERLAKGNLLNLGSALVASLFDLGGIGQTVIGQGAQLTMLKFSRDDETEADAIGLDIAARAGFDPRAGVALWQKMASLNKRAPPQWLSTHPAGKNRIAEIRRHLPDVLPLFAQTKGVPVSALPPYRSNAEGIKPVQ